MSRQNDISIKAPINSTLKSCEEFYEEPVALKELNLLSINDICETQQQATLTMVSHYKKPHPMLLSLANGYVSQQELVTIVKADAKIAGRILFIVNSPRFGVQQPIKDLNHAIMYLGISEVRAIATELALKASFESNNTEQEQSFNNVWKASALASSISLELGKVIGRDNASELSTLCLLFYLGDLILLSSNPESSYLYKKGISFYERIKETQLKFKTNSSIIGSHAARAWELPETMVKDIEYSLAPLTNDRSVKSLNDIDKIDIVICYLACRIAELAVFEQQTKVEQMNILNQSNNNHLEFFHISSMLSHYSLTQVKTLLRANDFAQRANMLISKHNH
ncbi:HDOD domain-containing protein [Thalassotalea atypica]|uniref:HDOD domain-containing protein n=1 Tax=Thalassotalea atypica TaxID=2054316 RepID=UPI0025741844|nr:HDOD domain-containing protein [Thalassotalea atypica]